jgi:hypothetical protein
MVSPLGAVPGDNFRQFLCMCVSALAGTSVGLFISSLAETEDQASTLVPIALIPQILLSGVVVPGLRAVPEFVAKTVISGYWISSSMGAHSGDRAPASQGILILAIHSVCFLAASWWLLYRRERKG